MPGKVKVKVLAGRNLPVMDRSSDTTDAYVEVSRASSNAMFRIRIHVFLCLPDPDPLVRGMDPDPGLDPSIIKQK
jgi:hypothetical protein